MEPTTQTPPSKLRAAYDYLKAQDVTVPADYAEFESGMQDPARLEKLYGYFKQQDVTVPDSYDEFASAMLGDVKKKPTSLETGPTGSLPAGSGAGAEPDQEFQSVPDLVPVPSPIQPEAAVAPGLQEAIPFAPGTEVAPLAANLPNLQTGAPGDLRAPVTEETDYLSKLPAFAGGPEAPDGKERVAIPNDYTGAVPPGSYQLKLGGEGDRTQYFDRDLSKLVDGQEQSAWDAASQNFGNQLLNMGKGGADYLAAADRRLRDTPLGRAADKVGGLFFLNDDPNRGVPFQEAADGLEALKGKVAPFHEKSQFRFNNPATWPMATSNAAALAAPMVLSALLPENKIAGVAQKLLAVGFDGQILESSVERAKAAGLTGAQADNFVLADGAASMLVFKLGGGGLNAAGQKLLQSELGQGIAAALKDRVAPLTQAELNNVLTQAAARVGPVLRQAGAGAASGGILFGANEAKNIAAERVTNAAVGREAFPNQSLGEMAGRVAGAAGEGALIGGLQGAAEGIGGEALAEPPTLKGSELPTEQPQPEQRTEAQPAEKAPGTLFFQEGTDTATAEYDAQGQPTAIYYNGEPRDVATLMADPAVAELVKKAAPAPDTPTAPPPSAPPETAGVEPDPLPAAPAERPALPDAQPHPDHVKPLTSEQQATNNTLDALDRYNALDARAKKGKPGSTIRAEVSEAARKAGLSASVKADFSMSVTREGKRATRFNEYTATTPAADHVPLAERPAEARPFLEDVVSAAEASPSVLQGLGINVRGKALSARELSGAVEDIRAGRNTMRAQLVLDTLETAHQKGYVEKSEGMGLLTRRFQVPVDEFVGGKPLSEHPEVPLTDSELDRLAAQDPNFKSALESYTNPETGEIDYARLAEHGGRGALETFFDVPPEVAAKVVALANERANQPAQQPDPLANAPANGSPAEGGSQPNGIDSGSSGPPATEQLAASNAPLTLAEQNIAAKQEFTDALAEFRAARKKGNGTAQSSLLGIPAFSAEESAALGKMVGAAVKLGAIKTKQIIARLRAQGLSDDDATDEQLGAFVKQYRADNGLRKPPRELPANEPEGTAQRASMKRVLADPAIPEPLKAKVRDTGLDKYEPKSVAETEQAVDAYMTRNSLNDAYAEAISTTDNLTGDVRTALRARVLKVVGELLTAALDKGDIASADTYLEQSYKVAEALAKRGTDAGREINAYKLLATTAPEAVVYKAQKEIAEQRQQMGAKLGKKLRSERRAIEKAKADALDNALGSITVRATREQIVAKQARLIPEPKAYGESNRFFTKKGLAEVREKLKNMAFSSPLPPDLVYLGAYHLEASTRKFGDWSKKIVRDVGERVRPHLPLLYAQAKQALIDKGVKDINFDEPQTVEAQLRQELADNLADRILAKVRPVKPGTYDPVQEMLGTLTRRASEDLPAGQRKPKAAREALAQAINNRREYQRTLQEARTAILEKIDKLKVPDDAKQRMAVDLTDFIEQVNDRPYAQKQFDSALAQAEDEILPKLGKTRKEQYDNLAKLPDPEAEIVIKALQDHVTQGIEATDTEAKELRQAIADELNSRLLLRRREIRARNGVFEEGQRPELRKPVKRVLPDQVSELLASRATPQQIAERVSSEVVRVGVKELGTTLDQIARNHITDTAAAGKTLAEQFMQQTGLPQADAQIYADTIEKEFSRRIDAARQKRLHELNKRAAATPAKRPKASDLQATQELFTLSPTDDAAILEHLKRVNDLPELTAQDVADLRKLAQAVQKAPEGFQRDEAVEKLFKKQADIKRVNWAEIGQAMWYANVLSGYKTHVINFTANVIQTGAELGVNTTHALLTGKGRYAAASGKGLFSGLGRGLREARSVLTTGRETSREPDKYEVPGILENLSSKNPISALKYVSRALRAGDMLFSSGLKEMRAYEQAVKFALEDAKSDGTPNQDIWARAAEKLYNTTQRIADARQQAQAEGLKGNDLERRIYEIAEQSRGADIMDEARVYAPRAVFNGQLEGGLGWVATGIQKMTEGINIKGFKPAKYIVPFTRVITNVANAALDYTPVGAGRAALGHTLLGGGAESKLQRQFTAEERQRLSIKAVMGSSVALAAYALSNNEDENGKPTMELTGLGTGSPTKDAQLRADGWQPYSIKVGDTWYSYANTPVAIMLAGVGSYNDAHKYGGKEADDQGAVETLYLHSFRALQFTKDMTALKGAADFLSAVDSRNPTDITKWAQRLAAGSVKGYVPFSSFLTQIAKDGEQLAGEPRKQGRSFGQMLAQDIPVARNGINNALDVLGDPLPVDTDRLFSSPPHRDQSTQRIWNWLNKNSLFISVPNRNSGGALLLKLHEGKEQPMTDDEYYAFMQKRGELLKSAIQNNLEHLEKMEPTKAKRWLDKHAAKVNRQAKRAVFGPGSVPIGERQLAVD